MISRRPEDAQRPMPSASSVRRFGPWPWYLSAADFLGLDTDVVDDIAGDLAEECAASDGSPRFLTRMWCAGQILRAIPYLAMSTLRRGQPRARRRLLGVMSALVATATSVLAAVQLHVGPPASITTDRGFDASDIVINNIRVVQMPVRALDARGHTVTKDSVRYERVSGDLIDISRSGAISCLARGDAVVRASVNNLSSLVTVRCRPVREIHTAAWYDFLPGDQPQVLRVAALNAGKIVTQLRGSARIADTSVATLHQNLITPRGAGASRLIVSVGDAHATVNVVVHEIVGRFDNLTSTQRHVALPLRLGLGDTLRLPVPAGTLWVKWRSVDGAATHPAITAEGSGYCHNDSEAFKRWLPAGEYGAYCYVAEGARIRVARSTAGDSVLIGALLIERMLK